MLETGLQILMMIKKYSDFFFQFNDRALFHLFVERETEELLVCNK